MLKGDVTDVRDGISASPATVSRASSSSRRHKRADSHSRADANCGDVATDAGSDGGRAAAGADAGAIA